MIATEDMLIDVVDEHDTTTGTIRRSEVLKSHVNFRVAHVFLFNRQNELLVQQLSPQRERHPGQWGSSVAAYLFAGETYAQAAQRRFSQELGAWECDLHYYGKTVLNETLGKKFISLFVATCEGPFQYDRTHIARVEFLPIFTIRRMQLNVERVFTPTFLHLLDFYYSGT